MRGFGAALLAGMALVPPFRVIVLPAQLRGMMSAVWVTNNRH